MIQDERQREVICLLSDIWTPVPSGIDGVDLNAGESVVIYSDRIAGWGCKKTNESIWTTWGRGLNSQCCFAPFLLKQTQAALLEIPLLKPEGFLLACHTSCPLDPLARQPLSPLRPSPKATGDLASPRPRHQVPLPRLLVHLVILVINLYVGLFLMLMV